jgi:hypothetical protein
MLVSCKGRGIDIRDVSVDLDIGVEEKKQRVKMLFYLLSLG